MNVLLVLAEDRSVCESLRAALPETDLVLFHAALDDLLRRLVAMSADLIIIDDSPRVAPEVFARIQETAPGTPILVLASHNDPETLARFTLAGVRACLPKPFSCEDLRTSVERVVRAARGSGRSGGESRGPAATATDAVAIGRHKTALRWMGRLSGQIKDSERLSQGVVDALSDVFDASRCAVLFERPGEGVVVVAEHGLPPGIAGAVRLGFSTGLMRRLEESVCLWERTTYPEDPDAAKEMQVLGARLAAPLLVQGRVRGAILVGDKASGLDYAVEERELLTSLARCASTSFENLELYADVSRRRSQLGTVLGNVTSGVVVVASDRTVSMVNQSAERILQVKSGEVVGRSVQKLGSAFADIVLRTMADGKARLRQEIRDPAIDATLGLSATPLDSGQGVVVVFSRLPEQHASREEIAYSPFWEYLASRVAQEIKNPMVAVNTFAQLLPKKYESEDFRKAFSETVRSEISRINSVVETLFEFARHPRLILKRVKLNDTVRSIVRSFEDELRARAIEVDVEFDPDDPEAALDQVFFTQAVQNVLQNSIEAMPQGGRLRIRTSRAAEGAGSELLVMDSGPGISEQDAPLVFMPFFSTKEQGMGLGLTMANRIMKQHAGDLELRAAQEGGSAFAFRLPAADEDHADDTGS